MSEKEPIIAIIDVETTGLNLERDQIIEFAVQKGLKPGEYSSSWRIKPNVPISSEAQAVHGISIEDLKDCPPFSELAPKISKIISGSDIIIGYNVSFDIQMIQAEFRRLKKSELDLSDKLIVDPLQVWRRSEPRTLEDAVERFVGKKHTGAHAAEADVAATGAVLLGMKKEFGLSGLTWEELADFCDPERKTWIGPSNHFRWQQGVVTVGFGKHRGTSVTTLAKEDASYFSWIAQKDFPEHVKEIAEAAKSKKETEFNSWLSDKYGNPE